MISTRILAAAVAVPAALGLVACAATPTATSSEAAGPAASSSRPAASASGTPAAPSPAADSIGPAGNALDAGGIQDIEDAISSGNTAALEQRFAPQVRIVTAGGGEHQATTAQAVTATGAVESDLTATWDWTLSPADLAGFRASSYGPLFPADAVIGRSSTGEVISFTVVGTAITAVLMAHSVASLGG
ncbi:hypothetical protein GCM10009840_17390 [Pseudolysinimonas kribbensis]|uniref:hypothetical protein n=1 Tax=Pseudolysinimonas kribbensis TaxID=433641 RepID=UPI0031E087E9